MSYTIENKVINMVIHTSRPVSQGFRVKISSNRATRLGIIYRSRIESSRLLIVYLESSRLLIASLESFSSFVDVVVVVAVVVVVVVFV